MMRVTHTVAVLEVLHLSRREGSDCISRCNPGEGLRSIEFVAPPHLALRADLSPMWRGEGQRP
ncbi:protein of unknown function [Bradyrhizobium vignae]|uniref:Uncharacterized protein n=1 Tax=Bradyrhizobium vignae TaxID=1549949 RepID=A0A2U3QC01_9BRAD|nr:protein of unknown function [Bradyrhizobium vignae]